MPIRSFKRRILGFVNPAPIRALEAISAVFALAVWILIYCLVEPAAAAERIKPLEFIDTAAGASILSLLVPFVAFLLGAVVALIILAQPKRPADDPFGEARAPSYEFAAAERDHPDVAAYIRAAERRAADRRAGRASSLNRAASLFFPLATIALGGALAAYLARGFIL